MKTDKEKYFIACCPVLFKKLKGFVRTPNNGRYVRAGGIFQCLVDDVRSLNFKFMCIGVPKQITRPATKKELEIYKF
jgi:hypothetical protein